jgi:DNA-binding SARP family transcriptional activator
MLEVRLFGGFGVKIGGETVKIPSRPAELLFIYLVLHPGIPVWREKLAGLFWPDSGEAQARSNLRHALWRLRQAIEEGSESGDEYIRCNYPGKGGG